MEAVLKKGRNGLFADSPESEKLLSVIAENSYAKVIYTKGRNYGNLKRFFKLVNVTFDMQETFDSKEIWRKHITMIAGHYDEVVYIHPKTKEAITQFWPKSIAFEEMEEADFSAFVSHTVSAFLSRYGTGITELEFMRILDFD